ncbi:MAG: SPOR domain-containing protein [Hyphomonadaceae bacterium]|nr:SPOR domain-containing protein [Hyphomonadaceae bacterium]
MSAEPKMRNRYADPRFEARLHAEPRSRHPGVVYVLMLVVALAFGGFVWQLYSEPAGVPRVTSPATPTAAPPVIEMAEETISAADEALTSSETMVPSDVVTSPRIVGDGPYVVQLAALHSEDGVEAAWRLMAARAPGMFGSARLDVERADLGARGVYHRVRAGYFADRENAALFCERLRRTGQDCIVVAR